MTKKAIGSSDPEKLIGEDYIYRINRAYGASSILFSGNTRVLEAFDDEYEGVVVNPEGLPTNPDAFSSVLRFSLTHWRRRVNSLSNLYQVTDSFQQFLCLVEALNQHG